MAMTTAITLVHTKARAYALAAHMEELDPAPSGVGVFEIDEFSELWEVQGYFDSPPDGTALALLVAAYEANDFIISKVSATDWVSKVKRQLTPVNAGRFFVHSAHDAGKCPPAMKPLVIEAAMAFGTGHHESTRGSLKALDALSRRGWIARNVADIGTGTGVLAMAAAKLWPCKVTATDIDNVATLTAGENTRANGTGPQINVGTAPGFRHSLLRRAAPFDLIIANILAQPLKRLAPEMARHAREGTVIILSGILTRQAIGVESMYRTWGFCHIDRHVIGEWTTLVLRKGVPANRPLREKYLKPATDSRFMPVHYGAL